MPPVHQDIAADSRVIAADRHVIAADPCVFAADSHVIAADPRVFAADPHVMPPVQNNLLIFKHLQNYSFQH